jgi:CheY-like chemotaxis protein
MNSGTNHPAGSGGRGRKRRRGRRVGQGAGAHAGTQSGAQSGTQSAAQSADQTQEGPGQSNQNPTPISQHRPAAQGKPAGKTAPKRQFKHKSGARKGMGDVNGNGQGSTGKRVLRGVMNHKTPDAGIYSAPMDHSYRTLQQEGNTGQQGYSAMPVGDSSSSRPIIAFIDDLFFMAKVQETARKLNVKVDFVKSDKEVLEMVAAGEEKPALIIIDLNHHTLKPLVVIPKLKAKFKKETSIIGFLSHLQGELKVKAQEAGCDMVLPRSAFSQNLPQLLRRHATSETELQEY